MNEKGFMYPVTLCILMLMSIFLTLHFNQYITEKKILKEVEQNERRHSYFLQSLKEVEQLVREDNYAATGSLVFKEGIVFYSIESSKESLLQITFRYDSPQGKSTIGVAYFDKELGQMTKWIEKG
jgi:competence protein ComGG